MPNTIPAPISLQTGSLYASNDASTFTGTGGPFGFSPWTGQFGGIVSSAGLASEPFEDTVYNVAVGDLVTFVVAAQNLLAAPVYNLTLRDVMPPGFGAPSDGVGLTVIDGTGTDLAVTGDLFGAAGLSITAPLAAANADSGLNVALVTFTLQAGPALPGPDKTLLGTAALLGAALSPGGANLAATAPASASTAVVTASPVPTMTAESDPSAVAKGQTIAFDVTLSVPAGTMQDLELTPVLPAGAAFLDLVTTSIVSVGSGLQTAVPAIGADGSVHFGTVTNPAAVGTRANIVVQFVVRADGIVSGPADLQAQVSAADPAAPGGRWVASVASSVGVVVPPPPPALSGLATALSTTLPAPITPFANLVIADSQPSQPGVVAVTLQNSAIGTISGSGPGSVDPAGDTFVATGALTDLQAAVRQVVFMPSSTGSTTLTVTVVDALGGVVQDSTTSVSVTGVLPPDPLFDRAYYLVHNPDVAAANVDPYQHYLTSGWKEGRSPGPFFDTRYYLSHNPDVAAAGVDPLLHFETFGWTEGRAPDPWFDPAYYLRQNPDVAAAGLDPLVHYELHGWREGRNPSLVFDENKYLAMNPDVAAAGMDPLFHYIAYGQNEGRADFLVGGAAAADPLVDPTYFYAQIGAALVPGGTAAAQQVAFLYAATGWRQGENPDPWFDTKYYLSHNPDVAAAGINPLLHYETYGWKEGRDPSAQFSTQKYLAAYKDVAAAGFDPLLHYVEYGITEGRTAFSA